MGTLIASRFSIVWQCFSFWVFFNRLALVFAFGATNETSSPPVSRVYRKDKHRLNQGNLAVLGIRYKRAKLLQTLVHALGDNYIRLNTCGADLERS